MLEPNELQQTKKILVSVEKGWQAPNNFYLIDCKLFIAKSLIHHPISQKTPERFRLLNVPEVA